MGELTGLFVPLITPFTADGELAAAVLERLAHRVLDDGATGIVALGTTAETATLSNRERATVLQICSQVCGDRGTPLIAGAGTNDTARSAEALTRLRDYPGVSAALVVVPYYVRPGEAGVLEHFRALAAVSPVPVLIYNVPYRTGQVVSWPALAQLATVPGIGGVKHAAGSVDQDTVAMMAGRPGGFAVLGGDDPVISPLLALGADGGILASAHVRTADFARLVSLWRSGEVAEARQLGHRLVPLSRALFAEPNPVVIKAVLHELGEIPSPAVRLPLLAASRGAAAAALELARQQVATPAHVTASARVA
ncbi:MAG: 4-hydroxy-tetrahydrodipicolinate synthase [Streptosporangiaceae bacterium]